MGLPIQYEFVYEKSYIDKTLLQIKVTDYLKNTFAVMAGRLPDDAIKVDPVPNGFDINLYLTGQFADFLSGARSFANFKKELAEENFCEFNFYFNITGQGEIIEDEETDYVLPEAPSTRVDKTMSIQNKVYLLGVPIKEKPIKIEYLRVGDDLQIIAGVVERLTAREYTRKGGEKRGYYTFVLFDGFNRANCVFFYNKKNQHLFERLKEGDFVVVCGTYSEKNGRKSLNISGISIAEKG